MKKIWQQSALLFIMLTLLSACVRNDGDIGNLFGNWVFKSVTCDDQPVELEPAIMINFQGELFSIGSVRENPVYMPELVGKWKETGSEFSLDADYNAGEVKKFPEVLGFGDSRKVIFHIDSKSHNRLVLSRTTPEGKHYRYTLSKIL